MRKIYPDFPYTEIQLLWLKTLDNRNRKFRPEQTDGCLRSADNDGFCCLGVATQLMMDLKMLIAEWEGTYSDDQLDENGKPRKGENPFGNYNLHVGKETNDELLPLKAQKLMNLRANSGAAETLGNYAEYPDQWSDIVDGRNEDYTPPELTDLNDNGNPFGHIATIIRMFPHFYFDNGGEPTEEVYRTDIFAMGFDLFDHREAYFK